MFQKRLKQLRLESRLKQTEVAEAIGVSNRTISSYEVANSEPDMETLKKLANLFNVSIDYLTGQTDLKRPDKAYITDTLSSQADDVLKAASELKKTVDELKRTKKE